MRAREVLLPVLTLLLVLALASNPAPVEAAPMGTSADAFAALSARLASCAGATGRAMKTTVTAVKGAVEASSDAAHRISERVAAVFPTAQRARMRDVLDGALSVVTAGNTLTPAAAGYGAEAEPPLVGAEGQQEAVRTHTTSKFLFAAGTVTMELLLVRLLYREPHGNRRRNRRMLAFFSSPQGFCLLTGLLAIPNGVAPVSVMAVLLFQLCDAVYLPAIVIAGLVRPYAVAAISTCPCVAQAVAAIKAAVGLVVGARSGGAARQGQAFPGRVMETLLWFAVVGAIFFLVTAQRRGREDEGDLFRGDGEGSEGEEQQEEEIAVKHVRSSPKRRATKASAKRK